MKQEKEIYSLLARLIQNGEDIVKTAKLDSGLLMCDSKKVMAWSNELILFCDIAGDIIKPWKTRLKHGGRSLIESSVAEPLASLKAVQFAADKGLLRKYKDLVIADTLDDLFQQGEHLHKNGYSLASAVIYRAVLEEKLRNLCEREGCLPTKNKPNINDFNTELYKASYFNKSKMQLNTAIAAIGNDAAHNLPDFNPDEVKTLRDGVFDLISNH